MKSIARHHNEWLSLLEVSGPFLSMPVLLRVFPQGLEALDKEQAAEARLAYEEWVENQGGLRPDLAIHSVWVRYVLERVLGFERASLLEGPAIPTHLKATIAEHGETLLPDLVISSPLPSGEGPGVRAIIQFHPPAQKLESPLHDRRWKASPATRMMELLRATGVPLGLATNGEQWMLVHAPRGETTSFISWYASLWFDEPLTLRAFTSLLGAARFFGVAGEDTLEAMLRASADQQQEVTDQLGYQVRSAVEVLIRALDKADQDQGRALLGSISESDLYEAALTVMMRLVFLFSAEERGLLLLGDPIYDQNYAVSTLRAQLRETADQHGEEVLERRFDAWCRLIAIFRAVHGGIQHDRLHLPAYGGSLFDPDKFPFLEGRTLTPDPSPTGRGELPSPFGGGAGGEGEPLPINNRTVLHLLESLQILRVKVPGGGPAEARRLSFRALDVEQIGHVYEGLLDHITVRASETVLGLSGTRAKEPEIPLSKLEAERKKGGDAFVNFLNEETGRSESALKKLLQAEPDGFSLQRLKVACNNDEGVYRQVLPFAGLLRQDDFGYPTVFLAGSVYITAGATRRATGTHYTPRSLTEPIVQHTLEPLVYIGPAEGLPKEEWKLRSPAELLELKVCDPAMGSAGFLVQVVRYLAERLVESWERAEEALTPLPPLPKGEGEKRALPAELLARVRELRQQATEAEAFLWELLRSRRLQGAKFRRQHPYLGYILDFYCHESQLAIELDGGIHQDPEQNRQDQLRSEALAQAGLRVIRFPNHQVLDQPETVLQTITAAIHPPPSPPGRGAGGEGPTPRITPEGRLSTGAPGETLIPNDDEERLILARRLVADRCIYGVDKNPLAVEIAKLSIWLTTMDKGRPFSFLDHALKCGDSLVGASADDFLRWARGWRASEATLFDTQLQEQLATARQKRRAIESFQVLDVRDAERKAELLTEADAALRRVKRGCDLLVGARLLGLSEKEAQDLQLKMLFPYMAGEEENSQLTNSPLRVSQKARTFHWEFEFPEVFAKTGFDAFVGNPPFLGGKKISTNLGEAYHAYLKQKWSHTSGSADLCAYFFLRGIEKLRKMGSLGFIATNTIAQGDTREVGLDYITQHHDGKIYNAQSSLVWPGVAAVYVSIVHIYKDIFFGDKYLDEKKVKNITSLLDSSSADSGIPYVLVSNEGKSHIGSVILGGGFTVSPEEAQELISKDLQNKDVLYPYINGQELNSTPDQLPSRWVINFFDWPIEKAKKYPACFEIVQKGVYPERKGKPGNYSKLWWQYGRRQERLYEAIEPMSRVLIRARTSKTHAPSFIPKGYIYSEATVVFAFDDYSNYSILQSTLHEAWGWKYGSTLKTDLRYSPTDCFQTFPFPREPFPVSLGIIGEGYHVQRHQVMLTRQEGLTAIYNRFNGMKEKSSDIIRLRALHVEMDNAVAAVYGWSDFDLGHGFHETPQGIRFTISETARREVLARLLKLNHERYEEEVRLGLHEKKKPSSPTPSPKGRRGKSGRASLPVPQGDEGERGARPLSTKSRSRDSRAKLPSPPGRGAGGEGLSQPSLDLFQNQAAEPPLTMLARLPFVGLKGTIYRCPMPFGNHDPQGLGLGEMKQKRVSVVVMLASDKEARDKTGRDLRKLYQARGFQVIHLPVPDFGVPEREALNNAVQKTLDLARQGKNIAVHCSAGIGRTGLFMAELAKVAMHLPGQSALYWVRLYIDGAVETEVQERFVVGG